MPAQALESYLSGRWQPGEGVETRLYDPVRGDELATVSAKGLDLAGAVAYARRSEQGSLRGMSRSLGTMRAVSTSGAPQTSVVGAYREPQRSSYHTTRLRRSTKIVSRQAPFMQPIFSRSPTTRNPQPLTRARLAAFSGKIDPWRVHTPARSDASIRAVINALPTPWPRAEVATYRLTSATPA